MHNMSYMFQVKKIVLWYFRKYYFLASVFTQLATPLVTLRFFYDTFLKKVFVVFPWLLVSINFILFFLNFLGIYLFIYLFLNFSNLNILIIKNCEKTKSSIQIVAYYRHYYCMILSKVVIDELARITTPIKPWPLATLALISA